MDTNSLAPWYRLCEYLAFGRALERARFAFLDELANARRILVLGEGDGRALQRMLAAAPRAEFTVMESSAAMIGLARQRVRDNSRVHFRHEDALQATLGESAFDAVVTFFFLDCFTAAQLSAELIPRIRRALAPGGIWLFADFQISRQGWQRLHANVWVWVMYRFFRITTRLRADRLAPLDTLIADAGFVSRREHTQRGALIRSAVLAIP